MVPSLAHSQQSLQSTLQFNNKLDPGKQTHMSNNKAAGEDIMLPPKGHHKTQIRPLATKTKRRATSTTAATPGGPSNKNKGIAVTILGVPT